jgi:hypothetical protein
MSFGFTNVAHFFATVAGDIVKGSRAVASVLSKVQGSEAAVEGISSVVYPEAVPIERGAFALLGLAAHAVSEAGDAASASGLNLQLDSQMVADIKAIIPALEQYAQTIGLMKPPVPTKGQSATK